ncbi:M15 family metallopeptidase [Actinophytocola sp.]|uniref:M15 family metallopeptidase n=1 Tax=Actinophytocola sp. TaxID=1872138 RepID=UPI0025BC3761|nr:M15 family metallopeptidase [Actinophytocola sp.]
MTTGDTLVAPTSGTTQNSGEALFNDIRTTANAIDSGDWLSAGLGVTKVAMDVIGISGDPLGAIGSAGVSWVLGAVSFLREPFDVLQGDPGAITSSASSWGGSSSSLSATAGQYRQAATTQTRAWTGTAADGYRAASTNHANGLSALSEASKAVSSAMTQAGQALASARKTVMDLISEAVQKIIQICIEALSKSWLSFGASIAMGIAQSVQKAVQTGTKLMQEIQKLVQGLQKIIQIVQQVVQVVQQVKQLVEMIGGKASGQQPTQLSTTQVTSNGAMATDTDPNGGGVTQAQAQQIAPGYQWQQPEIAGQNNVQLAQATTQTGPLSQNGWSVNPPRGMRTVPGTNTRVNVADGSAGDVLMHVLGQVNSRVENIDMNSDAGEHDDWGWAERNVRGSNDISNHASATAVDMNATRHVLGAQNTFTPAQTQEIHRILGEVDNVVRWGGDYTGRRDEMHFEINGTVEQVNAVAERLRQANGGQ